MGVSTDAILFFGVLLVEGSIPHVDFDAVEEVSPLARSVYYGTTIDGTRVSVVHHQSASCPMYALAITDTIITAWRGSPAAISFDQQRERLGNEHEATKEILALVKQHGLELEGDGVPKWYMASWWSE